MQSINSLIQGQFKYKLDFFSQAYNISLCLAAFC